MNFLGKIHNRGHDLPLIYNRQGGNLTRADQKVKRCVIPMEQGHLVSVGY
jgi:hypothetical protein